jgi:hypothetical protein
LHGVVRRSRGGGERVGGGVLAAVWDGRLVGAGMVAEDGCLAAGVAAERLARVLKLYCWEFGILEQTKVNFKLQKYTGSMHPYQPVLIACRAPFLLYKTLLRACGGGVNLYLF